MGALTSRLSSLKLNPAFNDPQWLPSLGGVNKLIHRFEEMQATSDHHNSFGFNLDYETFVDLYQAGDRNPDDVDQIFQIWSKGADGADALSIFAASIVCSKGTFKKKVQVLFATFDMDCNHSLSKHEMTILLKAVIRGLCLIVVDPPDIKIEELEHATHVAFADADHGGALDKGTCDNKIEKKEFFDWTTTNKLVFKLMSHFNTLEASSASQLKKVRSKSPQPKPVPKRAVNDRPKRERSSAHSKHIRQKYKKDHVIVIKKTFDAIDTDHSGTVTGKELSVAFRHKGPMPMFSGKDNNTLSFKQVLKIIYPDATAEELGVMVGWTKYNVIPEALVLRLKTIFDSCDEDCTARVSLRAILDILAPSEKLNKFVKIVPLKVTESDRDVTLHQLLARIFGSLPAKPYQQILEWAVPSKALTDEQRKEAEQIFMLYDKDESGEISMEEMRQALKGVSLEDLDELQDGRVSVDMKGFCRIYRRVFEQAEHSFRHQHDEEDS